jgi:hypothetical protein
MKAILFLVLTPKRPTKRAPAGWDSARFLACFLAWAVFRFQTFFSPAAGNANR